MKLTSLAVLVAACQLGSAAGAQVADMDVAAARDFGRQGLKALQAGDYDAAEDRFSRAIALHDVPTLHLGRARAREASGRLISAGEDYHAILRGPPRAGEPGVFAEARREAEQGLTALEPRIPHLTVTLHGSATVRVGGVEWTPATLGIPRLIDPGDYDVEATDPRGVVSKAHVHLDPGQHVTATLDVTRPEPPAADAVQARPVSSADSAAASSHSKRRTAAYVTIGVSAALLVASIVVGVIAHGQNADAKDHNRPDVPPEEQQDLHDTAVTTSWISTALTAAAVVGGGVGTYLLLSSPAESPSAHQADRARASGVHVALQATLLTRF